uniref:AlNc14C60G4414 protein n=1 Tax=Albugo laibachii Nc14 TaxID=890382 RepID=F0WCN0_9STRA|nr:AlNc14C60G4414 [Albugo laibachii Nc14]|eukprot:CCA18951.1 AlNc14C60G4414 [Albugo laibachii Nc14]
MKNTTIVIQRIVEEGLHDGNKTQLHIFTLLTIATTEFRPITAVKTLSFLLSSPSPTPSPARVAKIARLKRVSDVEEK